jgi:serine/threonine protein kinase
LRLIRKEIDIPGTHDDRQVQINAYETPGREGHILSMLRLIRHPNIVRLVATYSYRGTYNLLFTRASSDLATFLSTNERSSDFQSDTAIVLAMQGLTGAVATLHEFIVPEYNLRLKGYHHDLKPGNVLVDGSKFLLSDFGLSTLKELDAKSKTIFKDVIGYYIAPECESIEDGFQKNLIGQPSDIWALGCIVAVVLTYMLMGKSGVQDFERKRKKRVMNWTTYQFHCSGALNPAVDAWLIQFENGENQAAAEFSGLIRDMLQINPDHRPNAQKVLSRVNFLVARLLYRSVERQFKLVTNRLNDLCVSIEQERLALFVKATGLDIINLDWTSLQGLSSEKLDFDQFKGYLQDLREALDAAIVTTRPMETFRTVHDSIGSCVDRLWNLLSQGARLRCENALERKMVSTEDLGLLRKMKDDFKGRSSYRNVGLLAAIKYMTKLADNNQIQNSELQLRPNSILYLGSDINPQATMARVEPKGSTEKKEVLIEWMEYDARWQKDVGQELFIRVEAIAELLHTPEKPTGFRGLDCIAYYHNKSRHSFGLIFDLPPFLTSVQRNRGPCSLSSLIENIRDQEQRPSLGDKFQLAKSLAACVYEWHKVNWLHKAISAFNVILFPHAFDSPAASVVQPFVIGFNHSRPEERSAFSLGPPTNPAQMDYCHPEYLKKGSGYRREYDYYSLGMVLLEIGLWRTIRSLSTKFTADDQSPEKLREYLLKNHVTRLHTRMGKFYQDAVRTCLTFDIRTDPRKEGSSLNDVLEAFEHKVVAVIRRCTA